MFKTLGELLAPLLPTLGGIAAAGLIAGGAAYALFKFLGEKWLNAKFDERLADYRHAQQREIEELKFEMNKLMDRTTKFHQKEFDVLPEAWSQLIYAHGVIASFISPGQKYTDVQRMSADELDDFLEDSKLTRTQKAELKASGEKNKYFIKAIYWHRKHSAQEAYRQFYVYLMRNSVVVPAPIEAKFLAINDVMQEAFIEHEINEEHETRPRPREKYKQFEKTCPKLLEELKADIRDRLASP